MPEPKIRTIDGIGENKGAWNALVEQARDHLACHGWLGGEGNIFGHMRLRASLGIIGPGFWQIQSPVDQGMPPAACIARKNTNLTVLNPSRCAGILPRYPYRMDAFLEETCFINHKN